MKFYCGRTNCVPTWRRLGFWMVGLRARRSVQRVPVPRYLRASCQRVSPEVMRITAACLDRLPPSLWFGATSRRDGVVRVIRDGIGLCARVDVGFGEARDMVDNVRGYLLVGAMVRDGVGDVCEIDGAWMMATS